LRGQSVKHNPWLKFYPQDWLTDIELRYCSSAARGTLIDLMCLAHRQEDYGVVMDDMELSTRKKVAKCLSITLRTFDNHLTSLIQMKRICIADDGRLFIKRMVQDSEYSNKQSAFGSKGGNPTLKATLKPEQNKSKNKNKKQNKKQKESFDFPGDWMKSLKFQDAWNNWNQHRKEIKKPQTSASIKQQLNKLNELGEPEAIRWINNAIMQGWQGLYEPAGKAAQSVSDENYNPDELI